MQIEFRAPEELAPFVGNARTHSQEQVDQISASIAKFGFVNPILIGDDNGVIAGHGRLMAAIALGLTEVPVIVLSHLNEAERRALVIADNRIAENAGWDEARLAHELAFLNAAGEDLDVLGFGMDQVQDLLDGIEDGLYTRTTSILHPQPSAADEQGDEESGESGGANPGFAADPRRQQIEGEDEQSEVPDDPITEPGDVWCLGVHRLVCGDSRRPEIVAAAMNGAAPVLMITDPPYGVNYDPEWRNRAGLGSTERTGVVLNDDEASWLETWKLFPGDVAYVWHGGVHAATVARDLEAAGFVIRYQIIWAKPRLVMGRGDYHWQHEPCWMAVRKGGKSHWSADRKQTTLWSIAHQGVAEEDEAQTHSTQKPVECMRRPILHHTIEGETVYEPFSGSGSTLIAAEAAGRVFAGVELNPAYVDMAVARWQKFSGAEAVHEKSGLTFTQRLAARTSPMEKAPPEEPEAPKKGRRKAA